MQSGRVVRRGDLRSRVRRIKEHYLEPFDDIITCTVMKLPHGF